MDKVEVALIKMDELRDVQTENLQKLLERDAKVDTLLDKVDAMSEETKVMKVQVFGF